MIHLTAALGRRAVLVTPALITAPLQATTYTLEPDYTQGVFRRNQALYAEPRHWARWLTISCDENWIRLYTPAPPTNPWHQRVARPG